jgi:hypothetical protein
VIHAGSLRVKLGKGFSCAWTLCIEKANLVHYCIERYLALALVCPGIVAVVLPWYCLPQHPSLLGRAFAGWLVRSMGSAFSSPPETPSWGANVYTYMMVFKVLDFFNEVWGSTAYISLGAGTFADGTVQGSSRFLVEFPLECYELYGHTDDLNSTNTYDQIKSIYSLEATSDHFHPHHTKWINLKSYTYIPHSNECGPRCLLALAIMASHPNISNDIFLPYMHENHAQITRWWVAASILWKKNEIPTLLTTSQHCTTCGILSWNK